MDKYDDLIARLIECSILAEAGTVAAWAEALWHAQDARRIAAELECDHHPMLPRTGRDVIDTETQRAEMQRTIDRMRPAGGQSQRQGARSDSTGRGTDESV